MAYNEELALRIEKILKKKKISFGVLKMFGGICYTVDEKMCIGIANDDLMARVGPDNYESSLKKKGARKMDFTGKPMVGYVFVNPKGIEKDSELTDWVNLCLEYNPLAKSSKRSKKPSPSKEIDIIDEFGKIISKYDKSVKRGKGGGMGNTSGEVFKQEGIFKYAVTKTKTGYSFHSMVIYANPNLYNDLKSKLPKVKFQKGCVNFKSIEDFPVKIFEEHMKKSAKCDFSAVINHYKNKKK
jgi:hypothetical protein